MIGWPQYVGHQHGPWIRVPGKLPHCTRVASRVLKSIAKPAFFQHGRCTRAMHTGDAHGRCTRVMHTVYAHGRCTRVMDTGYAHGLCTRVMNTADAHGRCTQVTRPHYPRRTAHRHTSARPYSTASTIRVHGQCGHTFTTGRVVPGRPSLLPRLTINIRLANWPLIRPLSSKMCCWLIVKEGFEHDFPFNFYLSAWASEDYNSQVCGKMTDRKQQQQSAQTVTRQVFKHGTLQLT